MKGEVLGNKELEVHTLRSRVPGTKKMVEPKPLRSSQATKEPCDEEYDGDEEGGNEE